MLQILYISIVCLILRAMSVLEARIELQMRFPEFSLPATLPSTAVCSFHPTRMPIHPTRNASVPIPFPTDIPSQPTLPRFDDALRPTVTAATDESVSVRDTDTIMISGIDIAILRIMTGIPHGNDIRDDDARDDDCFNLMCARMIV